MSDLVEMLARYVAFILRPRVEKGTVLVNAAIVGVLKDTERRAATVVYLLSMLSMTSCPLLAISIQS